MNSFNQLCKAAENLNAVDYTVILAEKSAKLIPALNAVSLDGTGGVEMLADFVLCSIVVDGKLSDEEFFLMKPMLDAFFGEDFDYEDCKKTVQLLRADAKDFRNYLDEFVDMLGEFSEELKEDIITVCLLICAVDGKISAKEKSWIKQLIQ